MNIREKEIIKLFNFFDIVDNMILGAEYSEFDLLDLVKNGFGISSKTRCKDLIKEMVNRRFILVGHSGYLKNFNVESVKDNFFKKYKSDLEIYGLSL